MKSWISLPITLPAKAQSMTSSQLEWPIRWLRNTAQRWMKIKRLTNSTSTFHKCILRMVRQRKHSLTFKRHTKKPQKMTPSMKTKLDSRCKRCTALTNCIASIKTSSTELLRMGQHGLTSQRLLKIIFLWSWTSMHLMKFIILIQQLLRMLLGLLTGRNLPTALKHNLRKTWTSLKTKETQWNWMLLSVWLKQIVSTKQRISSKKQLSSHNSKIHLIKVCWEIYRPSSTLRIRSMRRVCCLFLPTQRISKQCS